LIQLSTGKNILDLAYWDVTNINSMFYNYNLIVTDINSMFYNYNLIVTDIKTGIRKNVMDMSHMFYNAKSFNQNIGTYDFWNAMKKCREKDKFYYYSI